MKTTLDALHKNAIRIRELRLRSLECELYMVSVVDDLGQEHRVCDQQGSPLSFRSQLAAKKPFKGLGVAKTLLVHDSPYNEMIGVSHGKVDAMVVAIANPDQDYS